MISSILSSTTGGFGGVSSGTAAQRVDAVQRAKSAVAQEDRSAVSTTISQIASGGAPIDTDRVSALRMAIRQGSYKVDPQTIAKTMMTADLGVSL